MGREYRIPRDSRLREASDRRDARISPAVPVRTSKIARCAGHAVLGIDVGEDFLDLALVAPDRSSIRYLRVALVGITPPAVDAIAARIADATGVAGPLLAFVDSPRAPRDMDCSVLPMVPRAGDCDRRMIDSALRGLLRVNRIGVALSMFPTPRAEYFIRCARSPGCKPHLRAIAEELLDCGTAPIESTSVSGGAIFTRFMLAGFALFPALERLGIRAWECFPDLQFRLGANGRGIPPKRWRSEALQSRRAICAAIARRLKMRDFEPPRTLDQADAAILALGAARGIETGHALEISCAPEGRFAFTSFPSSS